jgi:hypothetical protein
MPYADDSNCFIGYLFLFQRKSVKREFKALRLTVAIVGAFMILWLPHEVGVTLQFANITGPYVTWLVIIGSSTGMFNSSFNWVLYAGVSQTYQKAFKRVLTNAFLGVAKFCSGKSTLT